MKIAVLSLNPAVDFTVFVDHFARGQVNRASAFSQIAGGKGVNVASFLSDLGMQTVITGFLGARNSDIFEELFAAKKIEDLCIRVPGMTRAGIKIADRAEGMTTDINLAGLSATAEEIAQLEQVVARLAEECAWIVMAGSLPPGLPSDIYARFLALWQGKGKKAVLDTSGAALKHGLSVGPWLAKPNLQELSEWRGSSSPSFDLDWILQCAERIFAYGTRCVVVSMGEKGALYITPGAVIQSIPARVSVVSAVGAGDAMVAGLVAAQTLTLPPEGAIRLATACSLAAITSRERRLPEIAELMESSTRQVRTTLIK